MSGNQICDVLNRSAYLMKMTRSACKLMQKMLKDTKQDTKKWVIHLKM